MGNSSSQTLKNYISTSVNYAQNVSSTLNLENNTAVSTKNINNIKINNGGAECCVIHSTAEETQVLPGCQPGDATFDCGAGFNIDQEIISNAEVVQSISSEFAQQLSTQLQNTAQADISNALNQLQQNDLFSSVFPNQTSQDVQNNISNAINTTLNTSTVLQIVNSAVINSFNENTTTLLNCGVITGEACNINQKTSSVILVQNILSSIASIAQSNSEINDFYDKVNNAMSTTQEGIIGTLTSFFGKIFSALGTIGLVIVITGAIVLFLIVLIAMFYVLFRKKKTPQPQLARY